MVKLGTSLWIFFFLLSINSSLEAKTTKIKLALITPEGSTWTNTLKDMGKSLKEATEGRVKLKIYAGGVSGDEVDVLRKMKVGRIHGAGFSGVGLGLILPTIRVLETPLLYRNNQEIDYVQKELFEMFYQQMWDKGYVLLGFAEAGLVYLYSKVKFDGYQSLSKLKMWVWKGDPVAETFLSTFGMKTVPLHLADVNMGLETSMIDSFYSPPLAALAFQWYPKIKYVLDFPVVNSIGALVLKRKTFEKLSAKDQAIFKDLALKYSTELVRLTRRDNQDAKLYLHKQGIQFVKPAAADVKSFEALASKTVAKNVDKLYPKNLIDKVYKLLATFRKNNPQKSGK